MLQLDSVSVAGAERIRLVFRAGSAATTATCWTGRPGVTAPALRACHQYWAHEAALMAVEDWPLLRWRMRGSTPTAGAGPSIKESAAGR